MRRYKNYVMLFVPRRSTIMRLSLALVVFIPLLWCWFTVDVVAQGLLPAVVLQDLDHLQRNRNLKEYVDNIQLLIEPSTPPCDNLLAIVTSSPLRFAQRDAIRATWGKGLRTLFLLGVNGGREEDLLVDNYIEAKLHSDMIIYQFNDHYQNLTLKTGLIMKWTLEKCPSTSWLLKTDDDVLVNPWRMREVVNGSQAALIGYRKENNYLHRDPYNKWFVPKWLIRNDHVPQYLSGTGYLINVKYIQQILEAAYKVPMINLEDVYFTYLVANQTAGLNLTHDRSLSPYKPWLPISCLYWGLASAHSLNPQEILKWGSRILEMGRDYENNETFCAFDSFSEWLLY
ncbi:beta-1,3-galactosyltransferase 5-like isoform X1 [Colias croceus]|uniref:beta-1,3-galactosyltransferase 5-like isoform X1 n=1 Tax=Colias crocea TaxID=72248 RepID=UPI001E27D1A3|nr:beta-1,3-galactosyltransferase 5-like isoform X1 [Colias croceus]